MSCKKKGTSEAVNRLCNALDESSRIDGQRVAIAAGAFLVLTAVTLITFEVIRGNNKMVYEPKRKYAEAGVPAPRQVRYTPGGWLTRYKENELLPLIGLDGVTFLRFLRMMRYMTTCLAIVLCAVLIPVDLAFHLGSGGGLRNGLLLLTISDVNGNSLWAHVGMSYVATAIVLFFITINYRQMVRLRWEWFRSPEYQASFFARTLMLTHVPKALQSDAALHNLLNSIGMPYPTTEVHIGRVVGALPDLIEKHEEMVRKLERVLAKYLKDPRGVSGKRPTAKIGGGCCGGQTVDAIDHYTEQIQKYEAAIEQWRDRIAEKKPESFGFASLAAVPYAHAAARSLKGKKTKGVEITLAPHPRDIIWRNLTLTNAARRRLSLVGFFYLVLLCFINAVPLLAVALISQMGSFTDVLGFLGAWRAASSWSFSAVAGLAAPIISGLMGYLLPIFMRRIAKYRGVTTRSKLDRVIVSQYFTFLIISQFVIFTLVGVAITVIAQIISAVQERQTFQQILDFISADVGPNILAQYVGFSNYWMTWLPLRLWVSMFDLAQGVRLLMVWAQKNFLGRTPRDVRDFSKPPVAEYAILYTNLLFVFAVAMLYACLAPLIVAFAAVVFWSASFIFKYQMCYVYQTKVESGGRLWRVVVNRLLACIVFMQLILALALVLNAYGTNRIQAIAALPPIVAVIAFKIYCARTFDARFDWYIPEAQELANTKAHGGDQRHNRLQRRFGHPALHQTLATPMVHARVKHLLPDVYRGRLDHSEMARVDGRKVEVEALTGGLKIAAIEEDQLEYDPHNDSDVRSIMSGTTMMTGAGPGWGTPGPGTPLYGPSRAGTANDFRDQYSNYLASTGAPELPPGTHGEHFEMGNVRRQDSRENLLEKGQSVYSDQTLMGSGHAKHPSQGSYPYYAPTPLDTPGLSGPQQFEQGHHPQGSAGSAGYFSQPPRSAGGAVGTPPARQPSGNSLQQQYYAHGPRQGSVGGAAGYAVPPPMQPYTASPQSSPNLRPQQPPPHFYGHATGPQASPAAASPHAAAQMYGAPPPPPQQPQARGTWDPRAQGYGNEGPHGYGGGY